MASTWSPQVLHHLTFVCPQILTSIFPTLYLSPFESSQLKKTMTWTTHCFEANISGTVYVAIGNWNVGVRETISWGEIYRFHLEVGTMEQDAQDTEQFNAFYKPSQASERTLGVSNNHGEMKGNEALRPKIRQSSAPEPVEIWPAELQFPTGRTERVMKDARHKTWAWSLLQMLLKSLRRHLMPCLGA